MGSLIQRILGLVLLVTVLFLCSVVWILGRWALRGGLGRLASKISAYGWRRVLLVVAVLVAFVCLWTAAGGESDWTYFVTNAQWGVLGLTALVVAGGCMWAGRRRSHGERFEP